tara:strand:- start:637 stop:1086 length:450 start_codon:yes stop_codon:yes gene_type:complete
MLKNLNKKEKQMNPEKRKERPVFTGVIKYFPKALMEIARVSLQGNIQHHPDKPLHWDRSKSNDDFDALARHLIDAGTIDDDGIRHTAKVAWRALACLEKELELSSKGKIAHAVEQYNRNRDVKDHITSIEQLPYEIISGTESAYVDGGI